MVDNGVPFPAARPSHEFAVEFVGDEAIVFDVERSTYHRMSVETFEIWRSFDGHVDPIAIARSFGVPRSTVDMTLRELRDAGLMDETIVIQSSIDRRTILRRSAAIAAGAAGLPLITSISAPNAASALTTCRYSGQCPSGCCQGQQTRQNCVNALYAASGYAWQLLQTFEDYCAASFGGFDFCVSPAQVYLASVAGVSATFGPGCK